MTSPKDKKSYSKIKRDVSTSKSSDAGPSSTLFTKRRLNVHSNDEATEPEAKRLQSEEARDSSSSVTASISSATSTSANDPFVLVPVASTKSCSVQPVTFPPEFPAPVDSTDSHTLTAITESSENKPDAKPESDESDTTPKDIKHRVSESETEIKETQTDENKSTEYEDDVVDFKPVDTIKPVVSDAITTSEFESKPVIVPDVIATDDEPKDAATPDPKPAPYIFVPPKVSDAPFVFQPVVYPPDFPIPIPPTGPVTFSVNQPMPNASDSTATTVSSGIKRSADNKGFDSYELSEPMKVRTKRQRKLAGKGKRRGNVIEIEEDVCKCDNAEDFSAPSDDDTTVTVVDSVSGGEIKIEESAGSTLKNDSTGEANAEEKSTKVDSTANTDNTSGEVEIIDDTASPIANSGPFIVDVTDILTPTPEPEAHDNTA